MPCFDTQAAAEKQDIRKRLDLATRLLCEVIRNQGVENPSDELKAWWAQHAAADARRLRRESRV